MYVSLYDLGWLILLMITIAVSGYLIAVLRQAFCILGHVRGILDAHGDDIRETLSLMPEALASINDLAMNLKETAAQTNDAFHYLQDDLGDTVNNLRDGLETVAVYGKVIGDAFRAVFSKSA